MGIGQGRERLHNENWGYETNCFVCEPTNAAGLRVPFFHDHDAGLVVADVNLSNDFSGAPSFVQRRRDVGTAR